ncbi:hypothetical protein [Polyangium sorediatum]|uniref:Uncharacterized protein n=1 Tax=Polyangium sorediatum TaxID=889274 RepID=A0ABT6PA22_9BACT|nr:hypothetical protein [Polyangium sorediatum]MDI1437481.1 hypothetical protein [Polyangium sorediatum]
MSDLPSPPTAQTLPSDDHYDELLASIRACFEKRSKDKPSLFTTRTPSLYQVFLDMVPVELRQYNTCSACRHFVNRYGGLVVVDSDGKARPASWDPETAPEPYTSAIRALAKAVAEAPIDGVFLTDAKVWGTPRTGAWEHIAVTPSTDLLHKPTVIKTNPQLMAEKRHDHETLLRGLEAFSLDVVKQAHTLLSTESLYRSEAVLGVAKWLLELHEARRAAKNPRARDNLTWLAVARAPAGFCHVRSSMIGTLLEDLAAGMSFAEVKGRFAAKMHPLQYQRPQAAPTAGNLARAEKIVESLKSAGAMERRFARLGDIETMWIPKDPQPKGQKPGVFDHLKPAAKLAVDMDVPPVTMTWEKFARTVLPEAEGIEYFVPEANQSYTAMVTAKRADAPPLLQWDFEERRNRVSSYVYVNGSPPARWNLKPNVYHPVTAIALLPWMWNPQKVLSHHGAGVVFLLKDARDRDYKQGAGFFPSYLRSEYHEIRATMEAYAKDAVVEGNETAEACGLSLVKGSTWNASFRVTSKGGMRVVYKLDRWD